MGKPINITVGQRFGNLTIIKEVDVKKGKRHFVCRCDCGKISDPIELYSLRTGKTISCKCVMRSRGGLNFKKYNVYKLNKNGSGECYSPSGNDFLFFFDWDDKLLVDNYCWYIRNDGYALANDLSGRNKKIRFHRLIMSNFLNIPIKELDNVDHINGDVSDNRKENLRNITGQENTINKISHSKKLNGIMGVGKYKTKYIGRLTHNGINYSKIFFTKKKAIIYRLCLEYLMFGESIAPQRYLFEKYRIKDNINNYDFSL